MRVEGKNGRLPVKDSSCLSRFFSNFRQGRSDKCFFILLTPFQKGPGVANRSFLHAKSRYCTGFRILSVTPVPRSVSP